MDHTVIEFASHKWNANSERYRRFKGYIPGNNPRENRLMETHFIEKWLLNWLDKFNNQTNFNGAKNMEHRELSFHSFIVSLGLLFSDSLLFGNSIEFTTNQTLNSNCKSSNFIFV